MSKKRSLAGAGFEDIADTTNTNNKTNISINDNDNIINKLLIETDKKVMLGIYFDPEVEESLRRNFKKKRGLMSSIVNEATRRALQENGLL